MSICGFHSWSAVNAPCPVCESVRLGIGHGAAPLVLATELRLAALEVKIANLERLIQPKEEGL